MRRFLITTISLMAIICSTANPTFASFPERLFTQANISVIYVDPNFGINLNYPEGWSVNKGHYIDALDQVYQIALIKSYAPYTGILVSLYANPANLDPLEYILTNGKGRSSCPQCPSGKSVSSHQTTTVLGDGIEINGYPLSVSIMVIIPKGKTIVSFEIIADFEGTPQISKNDPAWNELQKSLFDIITQSQFPTAINLKEISGMQSSSPISEPAADGFAYPTDSGHTFGASYGDKNPYLTFNGQNWTNCYQMAATEILHAGADFDGSTSTAVHAIANGTIYTHAVWSPGVAVVIHHTLADGSGEIYSMYGHLQQSLIADGTPVHKGDIIGYLIDQQSNTHTHLEIKTWGTTTQAMCTGGVATPAFGPGYTPPNVIPDSWGYKNPLVYIKDHLTVSAPPKPPSPPPATLQFDKKISVALPWYYLLSTGDDRINSVYLNGTILYSKPDCARALWLTPGNYTISINYQNTGSGVPDVNLSYWPFVEQICAAEPLNPPPSATEPPPSTPIPPADNAAFITDVNYPDGVVVAPNQAITKAWRLQNTGTSTWGSGYLLVFRHGDQMNAVSPASFTQTASGQTVDISVNMTAPAGEGEHSGYWQLRNSQGTYFGPEIYIDIQVHANSTPDTSAVDLVSTVYPSVVNPGQTFQPQIIVKVNQGQLLQSRGDMLRFEGTDSTKRYGAYEFVAVAGTVNPGQNYTFTFYSDHPITAPSGEGTYDSLWQVWRDNNWAGPVIDIHFTVRNGGGTRPNAPVLSSPGNWSQFVQPNTPALCVNLVAGLQYDFQIFQSHDTPDSGWISNNCWTPPGLGPYTYEWHVMAKDPGTGLTSDWSSPWYFTIGSNQLSLTNLEFSPSSPSSAERVYIYGCADGFNKIGLGLQMYANTATDGSANGKWMWISTYATFCFDHNNVNSWPVWETLPFDDGNHLIKAIAFGPQGQTLEKYANYVLNRRRPNGPPLVNPTNDAYIKDNQITFSWQPAYRVNNYQLLVSTNSDPTINPYINQTFGSGTTQYSYTFNTAYPNVYWEVIASNEIGSSSSVGHFSLDWTAPTSSVSAFANPSFYDTAFPVSWGGSDNLSGVRWYDIQYRDGNSPSSIWVDWLTNTTQISSTFTGQTGHTYYFQSRAMDVAGNLQSWPMGNGNTAITIDVNSRPNSPWWNSAYIYKRDLLILNNDPTALMVGYPLKLHFDSGSAPTSGELYAASKSSTKGDDFRITYNNSQELSRYIQSFSSTDIDIWFDLQAGIDPNPGNSAGQYQLYYGNSSAVNPPANINNVIPPGNDTGVVGLWHFQDGAGGAFTDSSGNGNTGSLNNTSWDANGKFGNALIINGTSSYGLIPDSSLFNLSNLTIEGWYRFYDPGSQWLLERLMTTPTEYAYRTEIADWKFLGNIRGGSQAMTTTQLVSGRWYHLAFTYDGQTLKVFINGTLNNSQSFGQPVPASQGPVIVGRNSGDMIHFEVQGLRISNVVKSSFPYGAFGTILTEPSVTSGALVQPPVNGAPDLTVQSVSSYPNPGGGLIIQAVVTNQGNLGTGNGFYTTLYLNHIPTQTKDYSGQVSFWLNDPIAAGATVTLTTVITDLRERK